MIAFTFRLCAQSGSTASQALKLELGKAITDTLSPGDSRSYVLTLKAGEYMRVTVTQPAFATVLRLRASASSENLVELNLPGATQQQEPLCWIAASSREYVLELSAPA